MKYMLLTITSLVIVSLAACTIPQNTPTQTTTRNTAVVPPVTRAILAATPAQTTSSDTAEEIEVRDLVENFGKRLQTVSLMASDAPQEIENQYSDFVSRALLEKWMSDVSKAPGRLVSSPWPDRIEITIISKDGSGRYILTGFVVDVTNMEVVNGGAADRIPVRVVVQKDQGRWLITEYSEER